MLAAFLMLSFYLSVLLELPGEVAPHHSQLNELHHLPGDILLNSGSKMNGICWPFLLIQHFDLYLLTAFLIEIGNFAKLLVILRIRYKLVCL